MKSTPSRRNFLAAGLALPAAGAAVPAAGAAGPKIEYRMLGNTGLKVSTLGFGCMLASDPTVVERAVDLGINYIDTARSYQGGNNERMVGSALKGKRDKVALVSKAGGRSKPELLEQLDTSLKELGTDHLDVWYLHNRNTPEELKDEFFEAQEIARKAGKIRFRGVSYHFNMPQMLEHTVKLGVFDVALLSYNFTLGEEVGNAIAKARKTGLGIVGMKVMAGGYARIQRGDRLYGQSPTHLTERLKRPGAMLAALKYVLKNKSVDTAIIGITDFEELDEDMRAMSEPFGAEDERTLAAQLERIGPFYCRACGACSGVCDKGVRIADMHRCLMYAEGYGQFALGRSTYLEQPTEARATQCGDCAECTVRCPNGVDVRANLLRARTLFA
jgi:hypothetical protein